MSVINASKAGRTVSDPCPTYESSRPLWLKSRAVCNGEKFVKEYDGVIDPVGFTNLLLPFSPSMTQEQYNFYKAEAELPGIVSQYARIIVGGLLRKQPTLKLPSDAPPEAANWILKEFAQDASPIISFLDKALWEEMQTSRAWVFVDYPAIDAATRANMSTEDFRELKPYPVLWKAESVINWSVITADNGSQKLSRIIVRNFEEVCKEDSFHPEYMDTVWVHELVNGKYQIRKYQQSTADSNVPVVNGMIQQLYRSGDDNQGFDLVETITDIEANGKPLDEIPAWPLNGSIECVEPMLTCLLDREISLYNKMSRRNHLLYGASTYTPWIVSDLQEEQFDTIVGAGLGSWLRLPMGSTIGVLDTPTGALGDMDRAILATIEEMARMGIRMLSPETAQSGVALDIRNAAQTSQLGTLNIKISSQMASIIAFMLNWRYDLRYSATDIGFELSADFNPTPLGADWLRLATEWYQGGLIPRSLWLGVLKQNDMISPDYDDDEGKVEMLTDQIVNNPQADTSYVAKVQQMAGTDSTLAELQQTNLITSQLAAEREAEQAVALKQTAKAPPVGTKK